MMSNTRASVLRATVDGASQDLRPLPEEAARAASGNLNLLEVFFDIHDPTTLNRQGADVGTQYRSAIFYHDEGQKAIAKEMIRALDASDRWPNPIVTEVTPLNAFYRAEDYHQEYYRRNGRQPYCRFVVAPKVQKFQKLYLDRIKPGFSVDLH